MHHLHNTALDHNPTDCLFGVKFMGSKFFADDGFGTYVTFGNETTIQLFASTNDILSLTLAECDEAPLPKLFD